MYYDKLNELVENYFLFGDNKLGSLFLLKEFKDDLEYLEYDKITLPPIKKFLDDHNFKDTPHIYTMAVSPSFFDNYKWAFWLNGKHISTYDNFKVELNGGYLYLGTSTKITINSLLVIYVDVPAKIVVNDSVQNIEEKDTRLRLSFDDQFRYDQSSSNGLYLEINQPYVEMKPGEDLLTVLGKYTDDPIDYLFHNKIVNILLVDNDGLSTSYSDLELKSFYIRLKNTSNKKAYIFYDGEDPSTYRSKVNAKYPYMNEKKYFEDDFKYYLKNHKDVIVDNNLFPEEDYFPSRIINKYSEQNDTTIVQEMLNYNYDLFMGLMRVKHSTKYPFTFKEIELTGETQTVKVSKAEWYNTPKEKRERHFIKIGFPNYGKNPFEISFFGCVYQGTFIWTHNGVFSTVYISLERFNNYYNLEVDDLPDIYGQVILRSHTYKRIDYYNVDTDYNGVEFISHDWYDLKDKVVYDNGVILKHDDVTLQNIKPNNLVAAFPRRVQKHHQIMISGNAIDIKQEKKNLKVKVKIDTTDLPKLTEPDKYIYKNIFYTDYIDFRHHIVLGPSTLILGIDYRILAPNIVEFLRPIGYYTEGLEDEFIDMTIYYEGIIEPILKDIAKIKSFRYKFYNHPEIRKLLLNRQGQFTLTDENVPKRYTDKAFNQHIFFTKYFSGEFLYSGDPSDDYGNEFWTEAQMEFPEMFTTKNGQKMLDTEVNETWESVPRIVALPEDFNLQHIMTSHELAVNQIKHEYALSGREYELDTVNYRYDNKKTKHNRILYQGDIYLYPSIPLNFIKL